MNQFHKTESLGDIIENLLTESLPYVSDKATTKATAIIIIRTAFYKSSFPDQRSANSCPAGQTIFCPIKIRIIFLSWHCPVCPI